MRNLLTSGKHRVTRRGWWFFLVLVTLVTILQVSQQALAQPPPPQPVKMTNMYLSLRDGQNNYNLDARAGQDNKFFLDVQNSGTEPITGIKLSSDVPAGWTISIIPPEIATLNAGSVNTVDVNINPAGNATTNGQLITFTAQSNEIQNVKNSFFITVKPAQVWVWVWIAAGVVVVAIFVLVYMRFGRQS